MAEDKKKYVFRKGEILLSTEYVYMYGDENLEVVGLYKAIRDLPAGIVKCKKHYGDTYYVEEIWEWLEKNGYVEEIKFRNIDAEQDICMDYKAYYELRKYA